MPPTFVENYHGEEYKIQFEFNRSSFIRLHIAIDYVTMSLGPQILIPHEVLEVEPQLTVKESELPWFNKSLDNFQRQTVINILEGISRPTPYVIFGPPGMIFLYSRGDKGKLASLNWRLVHKYLNHGLEVFRPNLNQKKV